MTCRARSAWTSSRTPCSTTRSHPACAVDRGAGPPARPPSTRRDRRRRLGASDRRGHDRCRDPRALPSSSAYRALSERTAALRPVPEALEQLVPAVRALEAELVTGLKRRGAVSGAGLGQPRAAAGQDAGARGRHDRDPRGALPGLHARAARTLGAPRASHGRPVRAGPGAHARRQRDPAPARVVATRPGRTRSARALDSDRWWTGRSPARGGRGARQQRRQRLVGHEYPAAEFPPRGLLSTNALSFVIPVAFQSSDWGYLVIGGPVDTRATSAREKYNHWAAMLAVALDQEHHLGALRAARRARGGRATGTSARAGDQRERGAVRARGRRDLRRDVGLGRRHGHGLLLGVVEVDARARPERRRTDPDAWFARVHPDDAHHVQVAVAAQIGGAQGPLDLEHRLLAADGRYLWVRCRAVTVTDSSGCPTRMVGVMTDLSDAKRQEAALREGFLRDPASGPCTETSSSTGWRARSSGPTARLRTTRPSSRSGARRSSRPASCARPGASWGPGRALRRRTP
ncbi:PAS domain-containing protein [Oerskovia sp. M15]